MHYFWVTYNSVRTFWKIVPKNQIIPRSERSALNVLLSSKGVLIRSSYDITNQFRELIWISLLKTGGRYMRSTASRPDALPVLPPWPPPAPSARGRSDPRVRPTNASRQSWERGSATTASTTTCKLSPVQLFELSFFISGFKDSTLSKDKCLQAIAMQMTIVLDILN